MTVYLKRGNLNADSLLQSVLDSEPYGSGLFVAEEVSERAA